MNSIKSKLYIFLILSLCQSTFGQELYNRHQVFNTIFGAVSKINPYYLSGNPAFLQYDGADQLLSIESEFRNEQGEFREFFDPGTERSYNLNFSGKKSLDDSQIFKGMFSLQRLERMNWNWLAVKNYNSGSPFLFGDSTSGKTRYNGILMNAQYSISLTPDFSGGFSFTYNVDEGLKEISPRPTSDHRDMDLTIGGAYKLSDNFSAGASFRVFDFLEQINYREDEGAIYDETILFKIRGYDFPLRISKKVESRISYHNRYYFNSDYFYNSTSFIAAAYIGGGTEQITIKEDLSRPRIEGYWNNNIYKAGLSFNYRLAQDWTTGLSYKFDLQKMWAKHPGYSIVIMDDEAALHEVAFGIEHTFSEPFSAGIELNSEFMKNDMKDYHGNVSYNYSAAGFGGKVGADYKWNENLNTFLSFGIGERQHSDLVELVDSPSEFFNNSRYLDLLYIGTDYSYTRVDLKMEIFTRFPGIINFYLSYRNILPKGALVKEFSSAARSHINAALEFKVKVY